MTKHPIETSPRVYALVPFLLSATLSRGAACGGVWLGARSEASGLLLGRTARVAGFESRRASLTSRDVRLKRKFSAHAEAFRWIFCSRVKLFVDNSFAHALKFPLTECNAGAKVSRMASSELTSTQVAERMDVAPATVRLWCSQGKFKHARLVEHPRGDYWVIPENDLHGFEKPRMGRPPKTATNGNGGKKGAKK